jgi:hypothetical protein
VFLANVGPSAIPFDFDWCVPFEFQCIVLTGMVTAIGLNYISGGKTAHTFLGVSAAIILIPVLLTWFLLDNEFTQLMKGLQGERLRQAFKYLDKDQDGFIRPEEFKQIILVCEMITLL